MLAGCAFAKSGGFVNSLRLLTAVGRRSVNTQGFMCSSRKLWIDVDVGVDDAQGLMLALAHPEASVVGISAVHGNVDVLQVAQNIARILTLCGRADLPFYLGADEPLVAPAMDASFFHGQDGLGDVPDVAPAYDSLEVQPRRGHAATHLTQAAQGHEGELVVVATGPLTNIALACKIDEHFPQKVARLVVMGGAEAAGNVTPTAEYNFHCDPESAHVVMRKFPEVVLVRDCSWDCTIRHALPWSWVDAWLAKPTHKAAFMRAIMRKSIEYEQQRDPDAGWIACDPLAFALAVCDEALLVAEPKHCIVELQGTLTRGMSVFQDPGGKKALRPNVQLVKEICMRRFMALMDAATD